MLRSSSSKMDQPQDRRLRCRCQAQDQRAGVGLRQGGGEPGKARCFRTITHQGDHMRNRVDLGGLETPRLRQQTGSAASSSDLPLVRILPAGPALILVANHQLDELVAQLPLPLAARLRGQPLVAQARPKSVVTSSRGVLMGESLRFVRAPRRPSASSTTRPNRWARVRHRPRRR